MPRIRRRVQANRRLSPAQIEELGNRLGVFGELQFLHGDAQAQLRGLGDEYRAELAAIGFVEGPHGFWDREDDGEPLPPVTVIDEPDPA